MRSIRPSHSLHQLFSGACVVDHRGVSLGDASHRASDVRRKIRGVADEHLLRDIVVPQLHFTNVVAEPSDVRTEEGFFFRTVGLADGYVVNRRGRGALIANGDCALGVLWDGQEAVFLHLGLGCLWRYDGALSVLEVAIRRMSTVPRHLSFWTGGAIQPCCHGYSHSTEPERVRASALVRRFGADVIPGRVRRGPRRGAFAYDHQLIAMRIAEEAGIGVIESDRRCTSCMGLADPDGPGYGTFFSHTRDEARTMERNLALMFCPGIPAP